MNDPTAGHESPGPELPGPESPGPESPGTVAGAVVGSPGPARRRPRALGTLAGVVAPAVVAVVVWVVAAPRSELLSVGQGRGLRLPDSGADGGSQLLMLVLLLTAAAICAALALWRRHPGLRRPRGVPALLLLPGLACAVAAAAASPVAGLLGAPADDAPYGSVVEQAPKVGELFFDQMIYGTAGPSWDWLPPGAGWLVFGAMVAGFTVAALAHFSSSPDLADYSAVPGDGPGYEPAGGRNVAN